MVYLHMLHLQLLSGFLAFGNAPAEKLADHRLVRAPKQELPGEKVDKGHRNHIANDADEIGHHRVDPIAHSDGNGPSKLDDGDH